jgi:beta-galactosidase
MRIRFFDLTVCALLTATVCLASVRAAAGDFIVDHQNPAAADSNPGTEAKPLKTIQAAVDKAQPGDAVKIKAGVYHEAVNFRGKCGKRFGARPTYWANDNTQYITVEAFGDDHVILDGTIEVKGFQLMAGKRNLYVAPFVYNGFRKFVEIVMAGDEQLLPFQKRNPRVNIDQPDLPLLPAIPGDAPGDRGWYYDTAKDLFYVNLGGQVPGRDVPVRVSDLSTGVDAANSYFPRIRKLEIRGYNQHCVTIYNTLGAVVEDNYLHHTHAGIFANPSTDITIRRNTITHVQNVGMCLGSNLGGVVESNVIRDFNVNPFKTRSYAGGIMCNGITGSALRYNVITHPISSCAGMWPDCSGLGNAWYGNVLYRINNCGFYIEAGLVGNVLRWNHCFDNWGGIVLRQNYMNAACENYVHDNAGVGMAVSTPNADNTFGNHFGDNVIANNPAGIATGRSAEKTLANSFDRNTYVVPKDGRLVQYDDKQFKTIKELREGLGAEMNGKVVDRFDPASLGLASFRVFGTEKDWQPVAMYGNPGMERFDILQEQGLTAPYFWGKGTFRESSAFGWVGAGISDNGVPSTIPGTDGFLRHLDPRNMAYVRNYPGGKVGGGNIEDAKAHSGNYLVQVGAIPGKKLSERGMGFWSPALPTLPGAVVDVSMWMERSGVEPTDPERLGGVYVFVEWTNVTGQSVSRSYIVGGEKHVPAAQLDLASGTGPYRNVKGTVVAPAGAVWMRLAFGMRAASGWASFDDMDLQTRPGEPVAAESGASPIDAAKFAWRSVNLLGVVNRALVDEKADDGQGGWTDQGPTADMRNLATGQQVFRGVPYKILPAEKAVVVLRSPARPKSDKLPRSVEIPVDAEAATIAFLHTAAWLAADVENWRYVVQYADGREEVIRMIGRRNMADWTDTPKDNEFQQDAAGGWTRTAVVVHTSKYPNVSLYSTLWTNPRPGVAIKAIRMTAAGTGVPLLVAISLGTPKQLLQYREKSPAGSRGAVENRRKTISLDGTWQIAEGSMDKVPTSFTHEISVPGLADMARPAFEGVGPNGKDPRREAFWYRRTFRIDGPVPAVALLKIGMARYGTRVWLNGQPVGEHVGCFTPGYFNLRKPLRGNGAENELIVRVGASYKALPESVPWGHDFEKIRYIPGIYDSVELVLCGEPHIVRLQAVPDVPGKKVRVVALLQCAGDCPNFRGGPPENVREALEELTVPTAVRWTIREVATGKIVGGSETLRMPWMPGCQTLDFSVPIANCRLWSPEDPFLYEVELCTPGDTLTARFGMRSFTFDPATKVPLLNGRPCYLRGTNICIHRFFEDPQRADKPWREDWVRRVIRAFRSMHWNSCRYCIGFPPEMWYRIADEEGLMIQDEFPVWGQTGSVENLAGQYTEWMQERWNHPSVVIWDAQNETPDQHVTGQALMKVRKLDLSNRPWDNGWDEPQSPGDVYEAHPYRFLNNKFRMSGFAGMSPRPGDPGSDPGNPIRNRGNNAIIINEYDSLFLNRDGTPTTASAATYARFLPPNPTVEQLRETYARLLAAQTEFWRCGRRVAGVMHFCGLTYSRPGGVTCDNFIDIERPTFEPCFFRYVRDSFAPVGLMIDFWADHCRPGAALKLPVVVINDLDRPWQGRLTLRLIHDERTLAERTAEAKLSPFGREVFHFDLTAPTAAGKYQLVAGLPGADGAAVRSLRDFRVAE